MLFDFHTVADRIQDAKGVTRTNPPRPKPAYRQLMDTLGDWTKAKTAKKPVQLLGQNTKLDLTIEAPINKRKWMTSGVALMPAQELSKYFKRSDGTWDARRLKEFNLTPAQAARFSDACPRKSKGCMAICLCNSGQMAQAQSTKAQVLRHLGFTQNVDAFMTTLMVGIARKYKAARTKGINLGIRLNVTSDIKWEDFPVTVDESLSKYLATQGIKAKNGRPLKPGRYPSIMAAMRQVLFYDYTKVPGRIARFIRGGSWPRNYHLVWSLAETPLNRRIAFGILDDPRPKTTIAAAFDVKARKIGAKYGAKDPVTGKRPLLVEGHKRPLPSTLTIVDNTTPGLPSVTATVVDADLHDMRALDEPGTISGLRFKPPLTKGEHYTFEQRVEQSRGFVVKTGGQQHPAIKVRAR